MPQRNEKEGFLTKLGGGRKVWQKRWFVLNTNFMCYYKDQKVSAFQKRMTKPDKEGGEREERKTDFTQTTDNSTKFPCYRT